MSTAEEPKVEEEKCEDPDCTGHTVMQIISKVMESNSDSRLLELARGLNHKLSTTEKSDDNKYILTLTSQEKNLMEVIAAQHYGVLSSQWLAKYLEIRATIKV
jgi:hypothetical protein